MHADLSPKVGYMKTKEELYTLLQEIEDVQEKLVLKFKKFCEKDMFTAEGYIQYVQWRILGGA